MKWIAAGFAFTLICSAAIAKSTPPPPDIGSPEHVTAPSTQPPAANASKTCAQVLQELIEARREGLAPSGRQDWPPTPRSIAWNQARFQASERWHAAHPKTAP